jgi:hypothetical protein
MACSEWNVPFLPVKPWQITLVFLSIRMDMLASVGAGRHDQLVTPNTQKSDYPPFGGAAAPDASLWPDELEAVAVGIRGDVLRLCKCHLVRAELLAHVFARKLNALCPRRRN